METTDYKADEHKRLNTIIYGSALAAIGAIYMIGRHNNSAVFIAAFTWALISYSYWFFAAMHISYSADEDYQNLDNKIPEANKIITSLENNMNRCRSFNLYTIIASWILNIIGASLTFFHDVKIPDCLGWFLIYGSLIWVPVLPIFENFAYEKWFKAFNQYK